MACLGLLVQWRTGIQSEHDAVLKIAIAFACAIIGFLFVLFLKLLSLPAKMASELQEKLDSTIETTAERQKYEKQFAAQQRAIALQQFENSFFQQLELFKSVRQEVTIKYEQFCDGIITYHGLECFSVAKNLINAVWGGRKVDTSNMRAVEEAAKEFYLSFHKPYRQGLVQYFHTLYHVINFIDSSDAPDSDKARRHYTGLVTALLNDNELFLIFYYGISPDAAKLRPLIEKYGLLEHMDKTLLLHSSHEQFYHDAYKHHA